MTDGQERRYLVVVVGMLAGPGPAAEVFRLSRVRPSSFHFIVPATKPEYGLTWTDDQAIGDAKERLDIMLEFGSKMGIRVSGAVAASDDVVEAARAVAERFNEIILIDNPRGLRRWRSEKALSDLRVNPGLPIHHLRANPPLAQGRHFDTSELRAYFQRFLRDLERSDALREASAPATGGHR